MQLVSRGERTKVENIMRLVFDGHFDESELRRHMNLTDDCERVLDDI